MCDSVLPGVPLWFLALDFWVVYGCWCKVFGDKKIILPFFPRSPYIYGARLSSLDMDKGVDECHC